LEIRQAGEHHRELQFFPWQSQHALNTPSAVNREPPQYGTADEDGPRAESQGLQDIRSASDAAVEVDLGASSDRFDDGR
jgi:hypothetical protein